MRFRQIIITLILGILFSWCSVSAFALDKGSNKNSAQIKLDTLAKDLGKIQKNEVRKFSVCFVNSGDSPLIVHRITTTCDCVKVKWDKAPIMPGKTSTLFFTYKAKLTGTFYKQITIESNSKDGAVTFVLKGVVDKTEENNENRI